MAITSNPIINLANTFKIWYNVETLTFYNVNGQVYNYDYCIRRPVGTDMVDNIGSQTMGQRTRSHFMIAISEWNTSIEFPQLNCKIIDSSGAEWYVSQIENIYFGNLLRVYCESRAGDGVTDRQFPLNLLRITNDGNLPQAEPNQFYSYTFNATGGTGTYTWTIVSGELP
jgi:hypothetical protein